MINFMIEYIYSLMYVIGLTYVISLILPKMKERSINRIVFSIPIYAFIVNVLTYSWSGLASVFILGNIICMVTDFFYCCYMINEFKISNLLVTILYYNIFVIMGKFFTILMILFNDSDYLTISFGEMRWAIIMIINIFTVSITYNIFKDKQNTFDEVSNKYIVLFVSVNIIELVIIMLMGIVLADWVNLYIIYAIILMMVLVTISNYLIVMVASWFIEKSKMEILENSYMLNKQYLESLKREQEELSKFKHDYKNHLFILSGLIDDNSIESKEYLANLDNDLKNIERVNYSNNTLINMIINAKVNGVKDIEFDISIVVKEYLNFPEDKLSSLLFNLLDNAIDAARKSSQKQVGIKILTVGDMLLIEISNSVDQEPSYSSDKGKWHGKGMVIINEIVSLFEGTIDYKYSDNYVNVKVVINEINR